MDHFTALQLDHLVEHDQEWLHIAPLQVSEFEKQQSIWPVRIGANIAKPHYHIGPKVTQFYYLLCVLDGRGTFIQQKKTYDLRPGDIFCLFPQVIHEYYCDQDQPIKKLILAFEGKQALAMLGQIGLTPDQPHAANRVNHNTIEAFRQLLHEHQSPMSRLHGLYGLFRSLEIVQQLHHNQEAITDWLEKGREYIKHHFSEMITVEGIASLVGVERTHFSKMYRKVYGIAPIDFLIQLRMQEAQQLLRYTPYKILEIAQAVGYQDISSFSKAFKNYLGESPSTYRAKFTDQ